jgi:hypothetical protein
MTVEDDRRRDTFGKTVEECKNIYRNYGFTVGKDFPSEYYFMYNTKTMKCVRLYYNGRIEEYGK